MNKVYDLVELDFLEAIMLKMGFVDNWINKIMNCVRFVRYVVKCNNILSDVIMPRGDFVKEIPSPLICSYFAWKHSRECFSMRKAIIS
ncbi:reverse transcriptase [Gossypium australe]|uniref:Reverse transcriptase n=1 Tax=Gossypium australe TaxID=47621 RepID=A0A5B6WNY5_9ROSI|nr:reverse transcriptase [Gossypium australe]